jgi:hypothetical protein
MKVSSLLHRPDVMAPVPIDGLEPMTEGSEESWGEWTRWYLSRHRSPINRGAHLAGFALLIAAPVAAIAWRRWWLLPTLAGAGIASIAAGHAIEGNLPAFVAEPRRFFGKPLGAVRSGLGLNASTQEA